MHVRPIRELEDSSTCVHDGLDASHVSVHGGGLELDLLCIESFFDLSFRIFIQDLHFNRYKSIDFYVQVACLGYCSWSTRPRSTRQFRPFRLPQDPMYPNTMTTRPRASRTKIKKTCNAGAKTKTFGETSEVSRPQPSRHATWVPERFF